MDCTLLQLKSILTWTSTLGHSLLTSMVKSFFFVHLLSNERLIAPVTSFAREVHGSNVSRHFYSSSLVHQLGIRREFTRCLWQENFDALRNLVLAALRKKKFQNAICVVSCSHNCTWWMNDLWIAFKHTGNWKI